VAALPRWWRGRLSLPRREPARPSRARVLAGQPRSCGGGPLADGVAGKISAWAGKRRVLRRPGARQFPPTL